MRNVNRYSNFLQVANQNKPFYKAILLANAEITPTINFGNLNMMSDLMAITKTKHIRQALVKTESWESRALDIQKYLVLC